MELSTMIAFAAIIPNAFIACIACEALGTWKKEIVAKRNYDLAISFRCFFYEYKSIIDSCRSDFNLLFLKSGEDKGKLQVEKLNGYHKLIEKAYRQIHPLLDEAKAVFIGQEVSLTKLEDLSGIFHRNLISYISCEVGIVHHPEIYGNPERCFPNLESEENDRINTKRMDEDFNELKESLDTILKPYLLLYYEQG